MATDYTARETADLLLQDDVQLVDVREPYEFSAGHAPAATSIPLGELSSRAGEIDRDRPVVLVCRAGSRSAMATEALAQAGYDAHNLTGGMLAWAEAGLALEPADGHVAEH